MPVKYSTGLDNIPGVALIVCSFYKYISGKGDYWFDVVMFIKQEESLEGLESLFVLKFLHFSLLISIERFTLWFF